MLKIAKFNSKLHLRNCIGVYCTSCPKFFSKMKIELCLLCQRKFCDVLFLFLLPPVLSWMVLTLYILSPCRTSGP